MPMMEQLKLDVIQRMKDNGQYVTGKTAKALEVGGQETPNGVQLWLRGPITVHTLETGRKPGKVPAQFSKIIYQWSINKKMRFDSVKERKRFAYFTARKIAREGSWIHRQGFRVDVFSGFSDRLVKLLKETPNYGDLYDIKNVKKIFE